MVAQTIVDEFKEARYDSFGQLREAILNVDMSDSQRINIWAHQQKNFKIQFPAGETGEAFITRRLGEIKSKDKALGKDRLLVGQGGVIGTVSESNTRIYGRWTDLGKLGVIYLLLEDERALDRYAWDAYKSNNGMVSLKQRLMDAESMAGSPELKRLMMYESLSMLEAHSHIQRIETLRANGRINDEITRLLSGLGSKNVPGSDTAQIMEASNDLINAHASIQNRKAQSNTHVEVPVEQGNGYSMWMFPATIMGFQEYLALSGNRAENVKSIKVVGNKLQYRPKIKEDRYIDVRQFAWTMKRFGQ
jgi:hypothetical protein